MAIRVLHHNSAHVALLTALFCASLAAQDTLAQGASVEPTPAGSAPAGSTVMVKWSGPNGRGDYITVVRKGARAADYLDYKATSDGSNPVSLVMPAEPGPYEIRYVRNNPREVIATVPFDVTAIAAVIEGPASVAPDARFEVAWVGPNNRGDFVTIVAVGAATRAYGSYVDARSGTPDKKTGHTVATLRAPAQPGRYELRYVQQGTRVIGTRPVEVTAAASSVVSPPQKTAMPLPTSVLTVPSTTASGQPADSATAAPATPVSPAAPAAPTASLERTGATGLVRAPLTPAARTIALAGFTAAGTAVSIASRTIALSGFTASGSSVVIVPRTIALPGFTASGTAVVLPPRTIGLPGFTAAGESTPSRGLRK